MSNELLFRDRARRAVPRGTWKIDELGLMDRDEAEGIINRVCDELGISYDRFRARLFTRRAWDRAHMKVTRETLPQIRAWQDEYEWTRRFTSRDVEDYPLFENMFCGYHIYAFRTVLDALPFMAATAVAVVSVVALVRIGALIGKHLF